jgi:hypothetical protein
LPDDPPARRAERRADRQLAAARDAAGEQQVRDVRAGDEQHERDRALQDEQRATAAVDGELVQRPDEHAALQPALFVERGGDRLEIGPRLFD